MDLYVYFSKFVFLFLITIFTFNTFYENNQFWCIIVFHLLSFSILFSNNYNTLVFGFISLALIVILKLVSLYIYKNSDFVLWNMVLFLIDIGLVILYRIDSSLAIKQFGFIFIGSVFVFVFPFIYKKIKKPYLFKFFYLCFSIILILLPFIVGIEKHGATNWVNFNILNTNIGFQPSEFVKITFIFYLASSFRSKTASSFRNKTKITSLIFPTLITIFIIGILAYQRDFGGVLIFFVTYLVMFYITTSSKFLVFLAILLASLCSYFIYLKFPHIQVRIVAWSSPWSSPDHMGYQILSSYFAIGTYGFFGSGLTKGFPTFVPVVESDMIFSAICEEFGVLFGIFVICIFFTIFVRGILIALHCFKKFDTLLCAGFSSIIFFQSFLIIGGNIKLVPLTGVTLPFISYGGSSILSCIIIISVVQCTYTINEYNLKKEF